MIFYNVLLRFLIQSSLVMLIAAGVVITLTKDDPDKTKHIFWSTFLIFIYTASPVFFVNLMLQYQKELADEKLRGKIGTLYAGLRPEVRSNISYTPVFMLRRVFFVILTFGLLHVPGVQIQVFIFSNVLYIIYMNYCVVHEDRMGKWVSNYNEMLLLIICYHFVLFSNLIWTQRQRTIVGNWLIFFLFLYMLSNLALVGYTFYVKAKRYMRIKYLRKHSHAILQERKQAHELLQSTLTLNSIIYKNKK